MPNGAKILTLEQYNVMRAHGTEAPGSCALLLEKRPGRFSCAACGQPLFESKRKFESGTGWPSFNDPIEGTVETSTDRTLDMVRTKVHCANCGSHLGHVFDDGPPPSHLRYCINGIALNFVPDSNRPSILDKKTLSYAQQTLAGAQTARCRRSFNLSSESSSVSSGKPYRPAR